MTVEELFEAMKAETDTAIFLPWPSPLGSHLQARVEYDIFCKEWTVVVVTVGRVFYDPKFGGSLADCLEFVRDANKSPWRIEDAIYARENPEDTGSG